MNILKHVPVLLAVFFCTAERGMWAAAHAAEGLPPVEMPAPPAGIWQPEDPAAGEKPVIALEFNKGPGNEALVIKQVSICDQNNIWCVANNGVKDAVYQLTETGLIYRYDGIYVSAGREIVSVINPNNEVYELRGLGDTTWEKVEGLTLKQISRPSVDVGWGLAEKTPGVLSLLMYDKEEKTWNVVENSEGFPAKDMVSVVANAEDVAMIMTNKNEVLMRDLNRVDLVEKAKDVMKAVKKAGGGKKKLKKGQVVVADEMHQEAALAVAAAAAGVPEVAVAAKKHKNKKNKKAAGAKKNKKAAGAKKNKKAARGKKNKNEKQVSAASAPAAAEHLDETPLKPASEQNAVA
jgi:hypothetical protein